MPMHKMQQPATADGYYGDDELTLDDELDLSFLDDEDEE